MIEEIATASAIAVDELIQHTVLDNGHAIVDWTDKPQIIGKLKIDIGDYLIDEVRDKYRLSLSYDELDAIADKCIDIATKRYQ